MYVHGRIKIWVSIMAGKWNRAEKFDLFDFLIDWQNIYVVVELLNYILIWKRIGKYF